MEGSAFEICSRSFTKDLKGNDDFQLPIPGWLSGIVYPGYQFRLLNVQYWYRYLVEVTTSDFNNFRKVLVVNSDLSSDVRD